LAFWFEQKFVQMSKQLWR